MRLNSVWGTCAMLSVLVACQESKTTPVEPPPPAAVASVSIDPTAVSLTVGTQRVLTATVRDATGTPLTGRTVAWASGTPTVATVTGGPGGATATVVAVSPGTATITAVSEGRSISATVTVVRLDIGIVDAQWTQAVQRPDGMIPMVLGGNAAVLNVLLSTTDPSSFPGDLVLRVTDVDGTLLHADTASPPPFAGTATYQAPTAQFLLPSAMLRAGLYWQVHRDPRRVLVDDDSTNDRYPRFEPQALATVSLPPMRLRFVPITLASHANATGAVSVANLETYLPTMRRVFPMGAFEPTIGAPLVSSASFGTAPTGGGDGFWLQVLQDLDLARVTDTTDPRTYWMAVVRPPNGFSFTNFGGYSYIPPSPSSIARGTHISAVVQTGWFTNVTQSADLVTHELGHALGRRHSPCGGPSGVDPLYPNSDGSIGVPGHDVFAWSSGSATRATTRAASTGDVMGYCFPQWASPYTYQSLIQARAESEFVPIANVTRSSVSRRPVVVVRARGTNAEWHVLPAVSVNGFPTVDTGGAWLVELLDADGHVVASQRTDARAVDHGDARTLVVALPLDANAAATLSAVRVTGSEARVERRAGNLRVSADQTADARVTASAEAVTWLDRPDGQATVTCMVPGTVAMVVQDRVSGAVLASVQTSTTELPASRAGDLDVTCSDGVRTVRSTVVRRGAL